LTNTVTFAYQTCNINSVTTTAILCNLPTLTAGQWYPIVKDTKGEIPRIDGLDRIRVPLIVDSVSPSSLINNHGGKTLSISGANFPTSLGSDSVSTFTITFEDDSTCNIISTSSNLIQCVVQGYSGDISGPVNLIITVNTETNDDLEVSFVAPSIVVTSIVPAVASPVLPGKITFSLSNDFD